MLDIGWQLRGLAGRLVESDVWQPCGATEVDLAWLLGWLARWLLGGLAGWLAGRLADCLAVGLDLIGLLAGACSLRIG